MSIFKTITNYVLGFFSQTDFDQKIRKEQLTILVTPLGSDLKRIAACITATQLFLDRGCRVVFVIESKLQGKLVQQGFLEHVYTQEYCAEDLLGNSAHFIAYNSALKEALKKYQVRFSIYLIIFVKLC